MANPLITFCLSDLTLGETPRPSYGWQLCIIFSLPPNSLIIDRGGYLLDPAHMQPYNYTYRGATTSNISTLWAAIWTKVLCFLEHTSSLVWLTICNLIKGQPNSESAWFWLYWSGLFFCITIILCDKSNVKEGSCQSDQLSYLYTYGCKSVNAQVQKTSYKRELLGNKTSPATTPQLLQGGLPYSCLTELCVEPVWATPW